MTNTLTIGTRGSALALKQTNDVAAALRRHYVGLEIQILTIQTHGDATQAANVPLSSFGEKGIFAKELESALLAGEIDLAVHSMKDLAHTLPVGLCIAAVPTREDYRDALIGSTLDALPQGARVGTGSVRRRALLHSRRPDLQCLEIRGNIVTRLRKLDDGGYDAICLAVAGLNRLGLSGRVTEVLDPSWFIPDPGQGAIAIEARSEDSRVLAMLASLSDETTEATTQAERAFLKAIGGSCQTPVGALATRNHNELILHGMMADPQTGEIYRATVAGDIYEPEALGEKLANELSQDG